MKKVPTQECGSDVPVSFRISRYPNISCPSDRMDPSSSTWGPKVQPYCWIFRCRDLKAITFPFHPSLSATKTFTIWFYFRILSIFINKSNECSFYTAVIHPHCCSRAYYLIYIFKCFSKCRISGLESKTFHCFVLKPTQSTSKVRYGVDFQQQTCLHGIWKPV